MLLSRLRCFLLCTSVVFLSSCATVDPESAIPEDPWESWNRSAFAINETFDVYILQPAAKGYNAITPQPVQAGVGNFFSNLTSLWSAVNHLLQANITATASESGRFVLNSTVGIVGIFDVASAAGIKKQPSNAGKTLERWGVPGGPYVVLPLLQPGGYLRNTATGLAETFYSQYTSPWDYVQSDALRVGGKVVNIINQRAKQLDNTQFADDAFLDKYSLLRSLILN